jgi:uncharacterized protein YecT (DUF1311 family)
MSARSGYFSIIAILVAIAFPANSLAWSNPKEPNTNRSIVRVAQKLDCSRAVTQQDLNECAARDAKAADRKLNQVYQRLLAKQSGSQRAKLIDAQLAWIKFRDKACDFAYGRSGGGSIAPLHYSGCLRSVTMQRTKDLESYLEY